jgi:hypothetical protein
MTRRMDRRETAGMTATTAAGCHDWRTFRWKSTYQKKCSIPSNHIQIFGLPPNRIPQRIHMPRSQAERHRLPQRAHMLPLRLFRHHQTLRRSKPNTCLRVAYTRRDGKYGGPHSGKNRETTDKTAHNCSDTYSPRVHFPPPAPDPQSDQLDSILSFLAQQISNMVQG